MSRTMKTPIQTDQAPGPTAGAPYSQAVVVDGLVFVSGQLPVDVTTGQIAGATVAEQTVQIMRNLEQVLLAAGSSLENLVKTTVYLTTRGNWAEMNEAYKQFVGAVPPARVAVVAVELAPGALVEIDAIAHV
jgi:2-iminobutanoate/2-iminopropanoate deaminase